METSVVRGVEMRVESDQSGGPALHVQLLGPLVIGRGGAVVTLPTSRKVRALLAYLALAPRAVPRSQLCELLWDVPNDPRGELRWCLSKLRSVVDTPDRQRVETHDDTIALDLTDCFVDAIEVARATQQGIQLLPPERLRMLASLFVGEFLEGFEIDRNPDFNAWLTAQRRQFRSRHAALLERLAGVETGDEVFRHLEKWLELAPFDLRVHEMLLDAFAHRSRLREGEEHVRTTARMFEAEGLDHGPVREMWRAAKTRGDGAKVRVADLSPPLLLPDAEGAIASPRRASIAVMPFIERNAAIPAEGGAAGGLAHDLITRLAKLRSLFIIAQGTVFALSERHVGPEEAGRMLNVDYVVSGSLRRQGMRMTVEVELAETRSARVVWTEVFDQRISDSFLVLDEIGNRIVASIAHEIELIERTRAMLKPPNSLDAWEAYHRGLWHVYRFNKADNERAREFFEMAVQRDPTFARAYGGLSFAHFQSAFQGWAPRELEVDRAFDTAGQSLMADDRDPSAHWAMGRALWLRGQQDQCLVELEQAIDLSPNFALGHYTLAFVHSQGGDPQAAVRFSDHSRHLSPFDPLLFGMLGARAMALVRLRRFDEAADWALKAAARPNAHAHILAIAAYCLALAGKLEAARAQMAAIRKRLPGYCVDNFLTAMQFAPEGAALFREGARRIGQEAI
ncbi:MAG TPA: transcriptional regulator [Afipia sp.]